MRRPGVRLSLVPRWENTRACTAWGWRISAPPSVTPVLQELSLQTREQHRERLKNRGPCPPLKQVSVFQGKNSDQRRNLPTISAFVAEGNEKGHGGVQLNAEEQRAGPLPGKGSGFCSRLWGGGIKNEQARTRKAYHDSCTSLRGVFTCS